MHSASLLICPAIPDTSFLSGGSLCSLSLPLYPHMAPTRWVPQPDFPPESLIMAPFRVPYLLLRIQLKWGREMVPDRPRCKCQLQVLVKSFWVQVTENRFQTGFRKRRMCRLKEQGSPGVALASGQDKEKGLMDGAGSGHLPASSPGPCSRSDRLLCPAHQPWRSSRPPSTFHDFLKIAAVLLPSCSIHSLKAQACLTHDPGATVAGAQKVRLRGSWPEYQIPTALLGERVPNTHSQCSSSYIMPAHSRCSVNDTS